MIIWNDPITLWILVHMSSKFNVLTKIKSTENFCCIKFFIVYFLKIQMSSLSPRFWNGKISITLILNLNWKLWGFYHFKKLVPMKICEFKKVGVDYYTKELFSWPDIINKLSFNLHITLRVNLNDIMYINLSQYLDIIIFYY